MTFATRRAIMGGNTNTAGAFATAVMADSPFAWWKLNETTSGDFVDSSGNSRPLNSGQPSVTFRGKPGLIADGLTCVQFDDSPSDTGAAYNTALTPTAQNGDIFAGYFCICKPENFIGSGSWLFHAGNTGLGGSQGRLFGLSATGQAVWYGFVGSWVNQTTTNPIISVGETALIGVYHNPTTDKLDFYKNGSLFQSISHTGGWGTSNSDFTLGGANRDNAFNGNIQHAMVFGALSGSASARFLAHAQAAGLA